MIIVTGAAGFIGSCLVGKLNNKGLSDLVLVDDFTKAEKSKNLLNKAFTEKVPRDVFFEWLESNSSRVDFVYHIGARTDTAEFDRNVFETLNVNYSKRIWKACATHGIPLIYASSAATYGMGELGYGDDHNLIPDLKPLNPYGESKNDFDKWVLLQKEVPPYWAGMKFFNVYGPNEYHKGRMASVILHAFKQVRETGRVRLFRSHRPEYADGMQLRDFIYVKDVVDVLYFLMQRKPVSAIFNLGTGEARTFSDLAGSVFRALDLPVSVEFIDTPEDIRDKYQYFTQAEMGKLKSAGYEFPFYSLEDGIEEYVREFLVHSRCY